MALPRPRKTASIAEIATGFDIVAVQVDQETAIERWPANARKTVVARAMLESGLMKAIDRFA